MKLGNVSRQWTVAGASDGNTELAEQGSPKTSTDRRPRQAGVAVCLPALSGEGITPGRPRNANPRAERSSCNECQQAEMPTLDISIMIAVPVETGEVTTADEAAYLHDTVLDIQLPVADLFGVSMILPLITSHARDLGASPTVSGILGSVYGALQLFTSPLVGQWSDVAGRRFALLVCLFMSAGGYSIFAMATSVSLMFIARLPLGIFKHSQNISKAYLADIITDSEQAAVIGNFNAVSSVGFIVGPVVGGHVAERKGGFYFVALLAGLIFFINFVLVWLIVPTEKAHHEMKRSLASSTSLKALQSDEINFNSKTFWQAAKAMNWKDLWDLYFIKFLLGASVIIYRSNFSLVLVQKFETSPITNGYIISFNGIVSAFVGLFTGYISSFYTSNAKLVLHLAIMQVFTMISLSVSPSLWLYTLFLVPLCFATTITRVAATKLMLERGNKKDIGILMGFQQSCMSVARMLAPLVAGISQEVTSSGPSIMGAGFSLVAVIIMCWRPQDPRERKKYE